MTIKETSVMKSFFFFVVILLVGIFAATKYQDNASASAHAQADGAGEKVDEAPSPIQPSARTSEVRSSNADKKLMLRATGQKDGTTTYAFSVASISGAGEHGLYTKTVPTGVSMELPFNAWDPTDTYVFLQENEQAGPHFYVFKSSGESFANGQPYIDVNAVWAQKQNPYRIRTATGWASGTLLIVYTAKEDGSKGPPHWFEIPSTAIIQLAR